MKFFLPALLFISMGASAFAAALVTITGENYSSNSREIGIRKGSTVYFIDRSLFSENGQTAIINRHGPVTVQVGLRPGPWTAKPRFCVGAERSPVCVS
jgi:hypothetical protein